MNANYTYAKSLDEISDVSAGEAWCSSASATDVQNLRNDYGPADFDIRHRVVVSFNYDLPFFHGNRWLGGWTTNSIVSWNTGAPIGLYVDTSATRMQTASVPTGRNLLGSGGVLGSVINRKETGSAPVTYQYLDPTQFGFVDRLPE